ncbi:MAG: hypothetical protein ACFE96_12980 [Candidatus Hermodarchaeota archaeon]
MNQNEIKSVKLFGLKINDTIAVLLIYIIFILMLDLFPPMIYYGLSLIEYSPPDIFANPMYILYTMLYIVIPSLLISLFLYVLIICIMARKTSRTQEVGKIRWLCFRLDSTSLVVIFILSIINLILDIRILFGSIGNLITYLGFSHVPETILTQLYISIIVTSIALTFHIYTSIICTMNKGISR